MKKFLFAAVILCNLSALVFGQDVRNRIFREADEILEKARKTNAEIFSPTYFDDGFEAFTNAESDFKDGDDLADIQAELKNAVYHLTQSVRFAENFVQKFSNLIDARSDAQSVNAEEFDSDNWQDASNQLIYAAREFEQNDSEDAQEYAFDGEKLFRQAELNAIKKKYLSSTWELLKQADSEGVNDYAPKTLQNSQELIEQAEEELNQNRYDTDRARDLAKKAYYQVKHAFYIATVFQQIEEGEITIEDLLLLSEKPLEDISAQFDKPAFFDSGYDSTKNEIIREIQNLQKEKASLTISVSDLQNKIEEYEKELGGISEEKSQLRERLAKIEDYRHRVDEVDKMFRKSEAVVISDEEKITLRLISLTFAAGKSDIAPKHFKLLTKVQNAIKLFPGAVITVEGHTSSDGNDEANLQLSQVRAQAVFQYLFANLDIPRDKFFAIGFGESKPIANNETEEGRRKNRRIDITIRPVKDW